MHRVRPALGTEPSSSLREVDLDALIRALAPSEVTGARPVVIGDLAYDTRRCHGRCAVLLCAGSACRRARPRLGSDRARCGCARGRARARRRHPSARGRRRARGDGDRGGHVLRRAEPGARARRRDRDEREDNDVVPSAFDARGRRSSAGADRDGAVDRGRRGARCAVHDARGDRAPSSFREMVDAGDRSAAIEASSHGSAFRRLDRVRLRRSRLHEPEPGPPRSARHDGGVLPGEATALHRAAAAACRRERRRRMGAAAGGGARRRPTARRSSRSGSRMALRYGPKDLELQVQGQPVRGGRESRSRRRCAGSSTSRTCSARSPPGCCSISTRSRSRAASRGVHEVPGRFEAIDAGQPFAVLVDYAHTPDSLETVSARGSRTSGRVA